MKILAVDDKIENRYLLEVMLKGNGFQVDLAANGIEALEKLKSEKFDMIISDILMPEMDGYKLCRECQKDKKLSSIIFVFYTATYTDPKDEILALRLGADRFIRKPIEPDRFIELIREISRDADNHRKKRKKSAFEPEAEVFRLYSQRLVKKLEKKMLEVEESEHKYREIFNNANDAMYLFEMPEDNRLSCFVEVNDIASEMLGYSRQEFLNMTPADLDVPGAQFNNAAIMDRLKAYGKATFEKEHFTKTGTKIPVEISSHIFTLNDKRLVMSIARDITERKNAEMELRQYQENLEKLVRERTESLEMKNEELQRVLKLFENREFRIKELRDEVKELKSRLSDNKEK